MASSYSKAKGRSSSDGGYFGIPKNILNNPSFIKLTPHAHKLILDLGEQYRGTNNGDLCAALSMMKPRGWKSSDTLNIKLKELRYYGFIVVTQYGGLNNKPNLYAFSWRRIDKASKDSDFKVGETPNTHKQTKRLFIPPKRNKTNNMKKDQLRLPNDNATATEAIGAKLKVIK